MEKDVMCNLLDEVIDAIKACKEVKPLDSEEILDLAKSVQGISDKCRQKLEQCGLTADHKIIEGVNVCDEGLACCLAFADVGYDHDIHSEYFTSREGVSLFLTTLQESREEDIKDFWKFFEVSSRIKFWMRELLIDADTFTDEMKYEDFTPIQYLRLTHSITDTVALMDLAKPEGSC